MGTRSTIALEFANGSIGQVYCHWDGYLSYNGKILLDHYSDPWKLRDLIDLGSLSTLGPELGVKHPFDNPHPYDTADYVEWRLARKGDCTFYGRDRGEYSVEATYFVDFADYVNNLDREEYNYILLNNGCWYVAVEYTNMSEFSELKAELQKD